MKRFLLTFLILLVVFSSPLGCGNVRPRAQDGISLAFSEDEEYVGTLEPVFHFRLEDRAFRQMQGGYFDGTHFFAAMLAQKDGTELTKLAVLTLDGEIIRESDPLPLDHANNLTYVPKWSAFFVTHCQDSDGNYNEFSIVDAKTFKILESGTKLHPFNAMAFCKETDRFVSARWSGETFDVWDGNCEHLQSFSSPAPRNLSQGIFCDEHFVYYLRSSNNGESAALRIYDWSGNLVKNIPIQTNMPSFEPENVSIVNGTVYIGGVNHGSYQSYLMKLVLAPQA